MSKLNSSHYQDFINLDQWLYYLENLHTTEIDMGLSRIGKVAQRLAIDLSFAKVVTVAGTNGKGTTCAFIENALLHKEHKTSHQGVSVYSSPHILRFNERLRINKQDVKDQPLIKAFNKIEAARKEISLTYYEYTTLAALLVLMEVKPSFIILEVGLGGRLDATNIIDANISVITAIDLDHQAFLGNDRESIGFEKAGIMRENQDIVIGDPNAPTSVVSHACKLQAKHGENLFLRGKDFSVSGNQHAWCWQSGNNISLSNLKATYIPQDNVATALMALDKLEIPLNTSFVNDVITQTKVPGRTELMARAEQSDVILDVGHNPHATRYLSSHIKQIKAQANYQNIYAVVAMLGDKDISTSLQALSHDIDYWFTGALDVPRAASSKTMGEQLALFADEINCFDNIGDAFKMANKQAGSSDLILVFGSFFTVAAVRPKLTNC